MNNNSTNNNSRTKILFLCTGNSCRSQMAEGWLRAIKGDKYEVYSAGIEIHGMNPYAVAVMEEADVDISGHQSKLLNELMPIEFDVVITVCSHADQSCPIFPGQVKKYHFGFEDPPKMAKDLTEKEDILDCYRKVRDQIKEFTENFETHLTAIERH